MTSEVRLHRRNGASRTPRGGFPPRRSSKLRFINHTWPIQGLVGLAPLLFGSISRVHVYPLQDCRLKQVPPQRWQNKGGPPPITPQGWRLRDAKPNKRCMVQVPCCNVVLSCPKRASNHFHTCPLALATSENIHRRLNIVSLTYNSFEPLGATIYSMCLPSYILWP